MVKSALGQRVLKYIVVLVTSGFVGLVALLSMLWLERRGDVTLPKPTGPFAVGRATFAWGDESPDTLAPVAGTKREVVVWLWYPAAVDRQTLTDECLPPSWRAAIEGTRGGLVFCSF